MVERLLILGGTGEAIALAEALSRAHPELHLITSLAGVTRSPRAVPGEVRSGGFGGTMGLKQYLSDMHIDCVVDATHPFASQIADHAARACRDLCVPRLKLVRPMWRRMPGDNWVAVADADEAAEALSRQGAGSVFLTLGIRDLDRFAGLEDVRFVVRLIERPAEPLPIAATVVIGRGPFPADAEQALMVREGIDAIVTKASGGKATEGKILAARALGLPVVMITRPQMPDGPTVESIHEALNWLTDHMT
ncbi:MAG: cobalt-precorrin-6A reductase [Pseudomonadota bacterium]